MDPGLRAATKRSSADSRRGVRIDRPTLASWPEVRLPYSRYGANQGEAQGDSRRLQRGRCLQLQLRESNAVLNKAVVRSSTGGPKNA